MTVLNDIRKLRDYGFESRYLAEVLDISIADLLYLQRHPEEVPLGDQLIIRNMRLKSDQLHAQGIYNIPGEFNGA